MNGTYHIGGAFQQPNIKAYQSSEESSPCTLVLFWHLPNEAPQHVPQPHQLQTAGVGLAEAGEG